MASPSFNGDKYRSYLHGEEEKNTKWRFGSAPNYDVVDKLFEEGRTKVYKLNFSLHAYLDQLINVYLSMYTISLFPYLINFPSFFDGRCGLRDHLRRRYKILSRLGKWKCSIKHVLKTTNQWIQITTLSASMVSIVDEYTFSVNFGTSRSI